MTTMRQKAIGSPSEAVKQIEMSQRSSNFSGAFHALVQMLRDGGDPYQLARMIGLDFSPDENPMRVIQHLLAAFAEEKRERQRKLSLDEIVELIQSTLRAPLSSHKSSRVEKYHDPDWRGNKCFLWNS